MMNCIGAEFLKAVPGIIGGLTAWVIRDFGGSAIMSHLISFAWSFLPLWVGLGIWLVTWAVWTIHRIARGRDEEFQLWLGNQERVWKERYEQNFRDREAEASAILERNSTAIQRFHNAYDGWLKQIDGRLDAIETRLDPSRQEKL